jgi:hypothetical protein
MTEPEIEVVLQTAFEQCKDAGYPLGDSQKQILLTAIAQMLAQMLTDPSPAVNRADRPLSSLDPSIPEIINPLDELTSEQRQTLLSFIQEQESQDRPWKIQLLNDWLQGQESGSMQFIRELYGPQWLERVQPVHLAEYAEDALILKVGDRIEVSNSLWEWVQDEGPCVREWVACTVIRVSKSNAEATTLPESYQHPTHCTIRFDDGTEYEIQGIYEWNRYSWRWDQGRQRGSNPSRFPE